MELQDRVAVVTGASGGLGRHIALGLAAEGADIVVAYRRSLSEAKSTAAAVEQLGRRVVLVDVDVRDEAQVRVLIDAATSELGRLDILVNNAGISRDAPTRKAELSDWDATLAANLTGAFLCTKHALPVMMSAGFGRVLNISSVVGQTGVPGTVAYAASKAGLLGMTRTAAAEVARKNVTVNALALGYFDGGLLHTLSEEMLKKVASSIPLGRFGTMDELQWAVLHLVSPRAGYTTGTVVDVNGGLR
jgi:3-oxoacyl-[acyl-carrier protein] reductase